MAAHILTHDGAPQTAYPERPEMLGSKSAVLGASTSTVTRRFVLGMRA